MTSDGDWQSKASSLAANNSSRSEPCSRQTLFYDGIDNWRPIRLTLGDNVLGKKNWTVTRANLIDGEHAGFMGQRDVDMKRARTKAFAKHSAIASRVMAAHRAKYEKMSRLHSLDPQPTVSTDSSGRMHFELMMDGHSVVFLRLE